jgi:hypothetical protein
MHKKRHVKEEMILIRVFQFSAFEAMHQVGEKLSLVKSSGCG